MNDKKTARLRRAKRARVKMREQESYRLCVYRTSRHIYAQVIQPDGAQVVVCASSLDGSLRKEFKYTGNIATATVVGKAIAERAKSKGISRLAFDRSGFKYHGRIKALADAARESGLEF